MKLYEAEKGIKIVCDAEDGSKYITFDHLDGMYSYCLTEKGGVAHLAAYTNLEPYMGDKEEYKGFYQLFYQPEENGKS